MAADRKVSSGCCSWARSSRGDRSGVVGDFSRGDDDVEGEVGVDIYDEVDLVSEEGVGGSLMSPLCIGIGILPKALARVGAVADFDPELVGARPEVGGIDRGMGVFLDQAYGNGLCDELMEDVIEGILSQAGAELGEDSMGGGIEEVKAT